MTAAKLGQNFLVNTNVAEKLVRGFLPLPPGEPVLEIGPGRGILTELLIKYAPENPVMALELDTALFYKLRERFRGEARFEVLNRNVLKVRLDNIIAGTHRVHLISNVPYYISLEFTDWLLGESSRAGKCVFMLQKEFVDKLAATPQNKEYNPQGIMFNHLFEMNKMFDVQPGSFAPPPKVKSTVFTCRPRPEITIDEARRAEALDFYRFLKESFHNRRKTLLNNLEKSFHLERLWEIFEKTGLNPKIRAEQLPPAELLNVHRLLRSVGGWS